MDDVIRALFSEKFIDEIMRPQEIFSTSSIKKIFEKLAHSSIMRINATSMSKVISTHSLALWPDDNGSKIPSDVL